MESVDSKLNQLFAYTPLKNGRQYSIPMVCLLPSFDFLISDITHQHLYQVNQGH